MSAQGSPLTIGVTGGAGHVGLGVVHLALAQGHSVVALDRNPTGKVEPQERYQYKQVDATDFEAYKAAVKGCTALIHLAALFNMQDDEGKPLDDRVQHTIHNANVAMSYNTLCIASELGINRVVLASSVNAIGMVFSKRPKFDYLPLDEKHPHRPEDAYSISKYISEIQADSFALKIPSMRIASLRFHYVAPMHQVNRKDLHKNHGAWKDLWGWVSLDAVADACLKSLTVPTSTFPNGHEAFFICARTIMRQEDSMALLKTKFPEIVDIRQEVTGNGAFIDCSKAEKMLGWKEDGFRWSA